MTQYNSLNVKLSNSQLKKLMSAIENETELVLRLSSNIVSNFDYETNFPYKFFNKLQIFVKLLQIVYQVISSYQKLNYLRWYN